MTQGRLVRTMADFAPEHDDRCDLVVGAPKPSVASTALELRIAAPLYARKAGETLANFYFWPFCVRKVQPHSLPARRGKLWPIFIFGRFLSVGSSPGSFLPWWFFLARWALRGWCFSSPRALGRYGLCVDFELGIFEISSAQLED